MNSNPSADPPLPDPNRGNPNPSRGCQSPDESPQSLGRRLGRLSLRVLRAALLAYLILLLLMMLGENSLLFHPARYPGGDWQPRGLTFEDAWFNATDGTKLHGWYVPHDHPRAVILIAHGNGGNITSRVEIVRALHDRYGTSVMIFDYRGYGRSDGSPDEAGILADGRAARAWLANRAGIPENQIVLWGESLGGGVAVDLAADGGARGLILQSTFGAAADAAAYHFPWVPVRLLMRTKLDSAAKIADYHGPLLQVHGDKDQTVPIQSGRRLFEAANEPKQFVLVPGGGHNDPYSPQFFAALEKFLAELK